MNPLHLLLLPCVLAVSITGSTNDYSSQGRSGGGYGLLRPYPNYSGYNGGYNGYNSGYGGYGGGYDGYNSGFGGSGIGYPGQGYPGSYPGGYGGYPGYSGGPYGGVYLFLLLLKSLFSDTSNSNRPYNRPGYDGRPGYNYQSGYQGYRPGYNQYRPGFDRPYQTNGYFDGVRDGYDNFGLLGRKVSEIKKDDA
ncbi:PREDICTED: glycine-rich cell wall structural protein-like isoform X1 [Papilio xuthus]|uniref:Glycine-rich cell wall structural protein-like isoform X1 n=1 Tax=Papilio xuthus TaxID=66420 RepID=A0AAJ7EAS6_PAPXU|nr:PREDICTED: glycine-rich cell wall structural protein-like isoform X1 [Papilio xuthus]